MDSPVLLSTFALRVKSGPDVERAFCSRGERTVIGTDPSTDVTLSDATVSRLHAEILLSRAGAVLRDLGSRNGTWVNGIRVRDCRIADGTVFSVGHTRLCFESSADTMPIAVSPEARFGTLVGGSTPMRRLFAILDRAAASDCAVLLEGETGTGKETAAESIHREGARRDGPFVAAGCSGIAEDQLVEAFRAARGGTLLLDEIGELAPALQPKLLRAIEATTELRIVAATDRSLANEVNARGFRPDLFFRLAVLQARLPPLREHPEDIPLLVDELLARAGGGGAAAGALRSPEVLAELGRHHWPGNVRELRNYVERSLTLGECPPLSGDGDDEVVGDWPLAEQPIRDARETWLRRFERRYLDSLLRRSRGNVSAAARNAGIDRAHLYRLLKRHGIR